MKIGLLAYSTNTGLGYQTWDFAKNIRCHKILLADISSLNNIETHHERYENLTGNLKIANGIPQQDDLEWLTYDVDLLFICETPLNWDLMKIAERKGVKVVLQYNYEFLEYLRYPELHSPTILGSPSYWNIKEVEQLKIAPVHYLPVPIDIHKIPFRKIKKVRTITHIIGRPAKHDRNGAIEFLHMAMNLGDKYDYKIFIQTPRDDSTRTAFACVKPYIDRVKRQLGDKLELIYDTPENTDMYKIGDLLVLPRKYGGLCLPIWEAMSAGIPVIMTDISPNDQVLPEEWLVDTEDGGVIKTHSVIPMRKAKVESLEVAVKTLEQDIEKHNLTARELAQCMSWEAQKPNYINLFTKICDYSYTQD